MKKMLIILIVLVLIILGLGIYKFNFTNNDVSIENDKNINLVSPKEIKDFQKNNVDTNPELLSEKDKTIINKDFKELDEFIKSLKTIDDIKKSLPEINNYPSVEKAYLEGSNLFLKFQNGGTISYSLWNDSSPLSN